MLKLDSLYEKAPENWDVLAERGYPSLREVAKRFHTAAQMDRALNLQGASHHWHAGRNGATSKSERIAKEWLEAQCAVEDQNDEGSDMLLVIPPAAKVEKIKRILSMMGCEVEAV